MNEWSNNWSPGLQTLPTPFYASCCVYIVSKPRSHQSTFLSRNPVWQPASFMIKSTCLDLAFKTLQNKTPTYLFILLSYYFPLSTPYSSHSTSLKTHYVCLSPFLPFLRLFFLPQIPSPAPIDTYSILATRLSSEPATHVKWKPDTKRGHYKWFHLYEDQK